MPNQLRSVFGRNFAILGEKRFSRFAVVPYEPKLVFDFPSAYYRTGGVDRSSLSDAMTFARAGSATYVDATGTLQTAAANVPRAGHHVWDGSAWVNEGLLLESEARTNSLPRNDFDGAVVGVIGSGGFAPTGTFFSNTLGSGAVTEVVAAGTEFGMSYIDVRWQGTATATPQTCTFNFNVASSVPASIGQTWTASCFARIVGGSYPSGAGEIFRFSIAERAGGTGVVFTTVNVDAPTETLARFSGAYTLTDATADNLTAGLELRVSSGAVVDVTIRYYMPQLEQGATPSSPIPTAGSTVTRAADVLTIPAANLPWPSPEYIGPELVTNGTFATNDLTGWTDISLGTGTASASTGAARLTGTDFSNRGWVNTSFSTVVGKPYVVTFEVTADAGGLVSLGVGTSSGLVGKLDFGVAAVGVYTKTFVASATTMHVSFRTTGVTDMTIDNISVREINPLAVSIQMEGRVTYADEGSSETVSFSQWGSVSVNAIRVFLDTSVTLTGRVQFRQSASSVVDVVTTGNNYYSPGINVPFSIASRHGSTFINGAVDGTALTANTTPTALPDLSSDDLTLGYDYMGTIRTFRIWADDLGDTGIEEASA